MTTPLWVPLIVALLGVVSTVVGIVVTQVMANRRERASWQRETARDQQRWAREDQARTFEQRHLAYVEFYEALRRMHQTVEIHAMATRGDPKYGPLDLDWHTEGWDKLHHIEIYGTPHLSSLATQAYESTLWWGDATNAGDFYTAEYQARTDTVDSAKDALLQAIRGELGVPETNTDAAVPTEQHR